MDMKKDTPAIRPAVLCLLALLAAFPAHAQAPQSNPAQAPQPGAAKAEPAKPGTLIRDCPECPEMVVLPPGIFIMGSARGDDKERPARPVRIAKPFAIGKYEVTFDEWAACLREKSCRVDPNDHGWGRGRRPVINVDFNAAKQYAAWLSKKTGRAYRLPSEAEWEYAARGGTTTDYPWGDAMIPGRANCRDCETEWSAKGTAPAGSFPANAFGLHDLTGNVWEWVEDCWNADHSGAPADARPRLSGECAFRPVRGGSWYYFRKLARSSYRVKWAVEDRSYNVGFRVAREIP